MYKWDNKVMKGLKLHRTLKDYLRVVALFGAQNGDYIENIFAKDETVASVMEVHRSTAIRKKHQAQDLNIVSYYYDKVSRRQMIRISINAVKDLSTYKEAVDDMQKSIISDQVHELPYEDDLYKKVSSCTKKVSKCDTNYVNNSLFSNTKAIKHQSESPKVDQTQELHLLSDKKASLDHISSCINRYGMKAEQVMAAISACNSLELSAPDYDKYFKVATHEAKQGTTEERIKYIIREKMRALSNKRPFRSQHSRDDTMINWLSVEEIVEIGRNYNRNFNQTYGINAKYEHAREALVAAGVQFEIR